MAYMAALGHAGGSRGGEADGAGRLVIVLGGSRGEDGRPRYDDLQYILPLEETRARDKQGSEERADGIRACQDRRNGRCSRRWGS